MDYIGVIVGPDLIAREGEIIAVPERRARTDKSLSGYKTRRKAGDEDVITEADQIIKNTYRTLMTRGMKGCYVYFTDSETAEYFKSRVAQGRPKRGVTAKLPEPVGKAADNVLPFERVSRKQAKPYVNAVPILDLKFAAGAFSDAQFESPDHDEWAIIARTFKPRRGLFVAQVVGESMNRRFRNGAWCLFETSPKGTRNGRVVVAEHRDIDDPDTGGSYTVKLYQSTKEYQKDGTWRHLEIRLRPDSYDPTYKELVLGPDTAGRVRIIAELIAEL